METLNTIRLLQQKVDQGRILLNIHELRHPHWKDWSAEAKALLTLAFGRDDPGRRQFKDLADAIDKIDKKTISDQEKSELRKQQLPQLISILRKLWNRELGHHVFVVHGHNEATLQMTARLLESIGLSPMILREQADRGQAIIEKFETSSNVSFAVALLTGDDRGGLASSSHEEQRLRARQNVILELGFFLGKLGRERVCVLYQTGVEIPSDYSGVIFINLDEAGSWKYRLGRSLEEAGFSIDFSKIR